MSLRADARRLLVHQAAIEIAAGIARLARAFQAPGAMTRGEQMVKAALSIPSNIAEACGRGTQREFCYFIGVASGSAQELLSQLRVTDLIGTSPESAPLLRSLQSRTALVIKMLARLQAHPPALRKPNVSA